MENGRKKLTTTLPQELIFRVKMQSVKENRPISEIIEELITAYLEKVETS